MTSESNTIKQFGRAKGSATANNFMPGFANDFETEALDGALPIGQNSPQKCPYGLYAEQLSGSPFTAPRSENERSWLYRIRPSVRHSGRYQQVEFPYWKSAPASMPENFSLGQYRWSPLEIPEQSTDFITGMRTMTVAGDVTGQSGMAAHIFAINQSMEQTVFNNCDAEMMVLIQEGSLVIQTELGVLHIGSGELAVVPRGMVARYQLAEGCEAVRGYVCENYGGKFTLPGRGPIGANCLANPRDFKTPVAYFEDADIEHTIILKWCGSFHQTVIPWSPLDVVAWHGNYAPYQYDLRHFSPVGAILFDHPDPSIFTVLTSPSATEGTANIDFVIFPDRWLVAEHSFRPPWYHRNIMSEFMGNLYGTYDAKPEGFAPGAASLHDCMLPHGPDHQAFEGASNSDLQPDRLSNTMAFMIETALAQIPTPFAANEASLQENYVDCWQQLKKRFNGTIEGDWN